MHNLLLLFIAITISCNDQSSTIFSTNTSSPDVSHLSVQSIADTSSWAYFLQHLPEKEGAILNYRGNKIEDQEKHYAIINYDVGTKDLQQCADALMRLRAEYLFAQKRFSDIGFHFTSGHYYSFTDYCNGKKPVAKGNSVVFSNSATHPQTSSSLRSYLDIIYTYAGTISLAKELKEATSFAIGTVVITPGSPGHCFIITNEAMSDTGEKLYKLVEGYTPAQSIYVLKNAANPSRGCWHPLKKGTIITASYEFDNYSLKRFE